MGAEQEGEPEGVSEAVSEPAADEHPAPAVLEPEQVREHRTAELCREPGVDQQAGARQEQNPGAAGGEPAKGDPTAD